MKTRVTATVTARSIEAMNEAIRETRDALAQGRHCSKIDVDLPMQSSWYDISTDIGPIKRRLVEISVDVEFTFETKDGVDWAVAE